MADPMEVSNTKSEVVKLSAANQKAGQEMTIQAVYQAYYVYQEVYIGKEQVISSNYPLRDVQKKHFWQLVESMHMKGIYYRHEMMTGLYSTEANVAVASDDSIMEEVGRSNSGQRKVFSCSFGGVSLA